MTQVQSLRESDVIVEGNQDLRCYREVVLTKVKVAPITPRGSAMSFVMLKVPLEAQRKLIRFQIV